MKMEFYLMKSIRQELLEKLKIMLVIQKVVYSDLLMENYFVALDKLLLDNMKFPIKIKIIKKR
jgi:hypothetical protein